LKIKELMSEKFLQFIWQQQLFSKDNLQTVNGEKIEIISPGSINTDAGADFFNAKIKIDGQIWAGNIEIHLKASDWNKHKHHTDKAYDNVILHIVEIFDTDIYTSSGIKIPTLELKYDKRLYENYMKLITNKGAVPCAGFIDGIDSFYIKSWQNRLLIERFERKTAEIEHLLNNYNNSWEEVFYIFLAKNFGFKTNALPFEMLAKTLPYRAIAKQKDNLLQIEALLFGQSGLLIDECKDRYSELLKREYDFLSKKYNLTPINKSLWKFLRLRPVNFPTVRIAQFAAVLFKNANLFSKIIDSLSTQKIIDCFDVNVSEYWRNHYNFCKPTNRTANKLGKQAIDLILINTVAMFLFAYGKNKQKQELKDLALELLEKIKPEKNNITKKWSGVGVEMQNAFESQAMIELYNEYCKLGRCLDCSIGSKIIIKENY
jgi:hypothetical protein